VEKENGRFLTSGFGNAIWVSVDRTLGHHEMRFTVRAVMQDYLKMRFFSRQFEPRGRLAHALPDKVPFASRVFSAWDAHQHRASPSCLIPSSGRFPLADFGHQGLKRKLPANNRTSGFCHLAQWDDKNFPEKCRNGILGNRVAVEKFSRRRN